jgi:hypothetical protein
MTVTWNSITFLEVFAVSLSTGGPRQGRNTPWPQGQGGSVNVGAYGAAGMSVSNVGTRGAFTVSGGGISFSGFAIMENVNAEPELNGVTRFNATLTLCD